MIDTLTRRGFVGGMAAAALTGPSLMAAGPLDTRLGTALTPAHFPKHTGKDVDDMFEKAKQLGPIAVFIYQWGQKDFLNVAKQMNAKSQQDGLTPVMSLSPTRLDNGRGDLDVPDSVRKKAGRKLTFANRDVHIPFIQAAQELAKLKPPYLCLATEINFLAFRDIKEYVTFAEVYKKTIPELRKISPNTKYFVSFQWDYFHVMLQREPKKLKEHAKLFEVFMPQLDVIGLTTYPADHFGSPSELPRDYYSKIWEYVPRNKKIVYSEIGWPTTGRGNENSQQAYIERLPELMEDVNPEFLAWSLLHDVSVPEMGDNLGTTGLITNSGRPKPGFEALKRVTDAQPQGRRRR